jgi:hypothetical protein
MTQTEQPMPAPSVQTPASLSFLGTLLVLNFDGHWYSVLMVLLCMGSRLVNATMVEEEQHTYA